MGSEMCIRDRPKGSHAQKGPQEVPRDHFRLILDAFGRHFGGIFDIFWRNFGEVLLCYFLIVWEVFGRYLGTIWEGCGRSAHAKTLMTLRIYDGRFLVSHRSC